MSPISCIGICMCICICICNLSLQTSAENKNLNRGGVCGFSPSNISLFAFLSIILNPLLCQKALRMCNFVPPFSTQGQICLSYFCFQTFKYIFKLKWISYKPIGKNTWKWVFELPQLFQIQSGSPKPMNFQSVGEPDYFIPTLGQSVSELIITQWSWSKLGCGQSTWHHFDQEPRSPSYRRPQLTSKCLSKTYINVYDQKEICNVLHGGFINIQKGKSAFL